MTEPPIIVRQGPQWLADLLFNPPDWLYASVVLGTLAVAGLLAWAGARVDWTPTLVSEIVGNGLTVACIGGVTWLLVRSGTFGYVFDVVGGITVGYCVAFATTAVLRRASVFEWLMVNLDGGTNTAK